MIVIRVGHLTQKASPWLVGFVFFCASLSTVLLYLTVQGQTRAEDLSSVTNNQFNQSFAY